MLSDSSPTSKENGFSKYDSDTSKQGLDENFGYRRLSRPTHIDINGEKMRKVKLVDNLCFSIIFL